MAEPDQAISRVELADLDPAEAELLDRARKAQARAYAPYSGFLVGAALRATDGSVFDGCNVENAAYPATICAERTAVVSAVAAGHRRFDAIAVVGSGEGPTSPCGTCRQVLVEFGPGIRVIFAGVEGPAAVTTVAGLLPAGFDAERLATGQGHPPRLP